MNTIGYFEIQTNNPLALIDFYQQLFGWKFEQQFGLSIDYWHIETNSISGGLLKRPAPTPPPAHSANAFVCSIEVEDYDLMQAKILQLGGAIVVFKFAIPNRCWQGYFTDPDANTFGLFQSDFNAK